MKKIIKALAFLSLVLLVAVAAVKLPDWIAGGMKDDGVTVVNDTTDQSGPRSVRTYEDTLKILSSGAGNTKLFETKSLEQLLGYDESFMKKLEKQLGQFAKIKGLDFSISEKQLKKNFCKADYYNIRDNENGTNGLSLWSLSFKNKKKGTKYHIGFDLEQEKIFYYQEKKSAKFNSHEKNEGKIMLIRQIGTALVKYYGVRKMDEELNISKGVLSGYLTVESETINIPLTLFFHESKDGNTYDAFTFSFGGLAFDGSAGNESGISMYDSAGIAAK